MVSNKTLAGKFLSQGKLQWLIVLFCQFIFIGFVCSRALASIGMMAILGLSLIFYGIPGTFRRYFRKKELLVLSLYFLIVFISGIYSEDKESWLNWVRIKLPYIALPLAFAPLGKLDDKKFWWLIHGFIFTMVISAIVVLIRYYLNYQAITESFNRGNGIPMPFSHIRYTLMLAFSFFCCLYVLEQKYFLFDETEKWPLIIMAVFIFLALHILTVRSGLLALYLGVFYWVLYQIFKRRRFLVGAVLLVALAFLPLVAYRTIPSLHNKFNYMDYDLKQYQSGNINEYSDAMRIVSMKAGIKVWKQNILIGKGSGDIEKETNMVYDSDYPQISISNRRVPHNQFIWLLATTGVIGLAAFLLAFMFPLFATRYYKNWIFLVFHLILFSSFFTEDTFEEQIGTGFYIIFLMILMNRLQPNE